MKNTAFKVSKNKCMWSNVPNDDKDVCVMCVLFYCFISLYIMRVPLWYAFAYLQYIYYFCIYILTNLCSLHLNMSVFLKTFGKFS